MDNKLRLVMVVIMASWLTESFCMVPPEASRPRNKRSARVNIANPEAVFLRMNGALRHPFYDTIARRPGQPTRTHSCSRIRGVPATLRSSRVMRPNGLSTFYSKYTEAYGIPVIGSSRVSNDALQRACYILRYMLADNANVRLAFYKLSGRVAIIARSEGTTSIPEHAFLPAWWNERARGLGATWNAPVSSAGEENALCLPHGQDRYWNDDIVLHEYLHALHNLGLNYAVSGFEQTMEQLYKHVKAGNRLWYNTYSMSTDREYFAEAAQSYLNAHTEANPPNGIHNHVNTRSELRQYDPRIYKIMEHVFTCNNVYLPRCDSTKTRSQQRAAENRQVLRMDCTKGRSTSTTTTSTGPGQGTGSRPRPVTPTVCRDRNQHCNYWSRIGECSRNSGYMHVECRRSCRLC